MSIKLRLQRLEDAQKAKSVHQETAESRQKTIDWINNTTRDINERARLVAEGLVIQGPPEPIKPLKANPTHTDIWIHRMLVEAREIERRELDASYELKNPTG